MRIVFAIAVLFLTGCNNLKKDDSKPTVCIHSTTITTKTPSCAGTNASQRIATYCTDESSKDACKNLSVDCTTSSLTIYDDTIITYEDKKCETSGYTLSCTKDPSFKVSDLNFCPHL
jgi:hypothetical protein